MPFVCVTCGEHKFETCRPSLNFESTRQYMLAFERTEKLTLWTRKLIREVTSRSSDMAFSCFTGLGCSKLG